MSLSSHELGCLDVPKDYFRGRAYQPLLQPRNILLFLREMKSTLQQEALQDRSHHRFVLVFNLQTSGHVHVDHLSFSFQPGQALLIFPYQFHHYSGLATNSLQWLFCTFEIESSEMFNSLRDRIVDVGDEASTILGKLLRYWNMPHGDLSDGILQPILLELLLVLKQTRYPAHVTTGSKEGENALIWRVNEFLAQTSGTAVHVRDLSKSFKISESRLRTLFKAAAGVPLGAYLLNNRINNAMALLRNSDLPLTEITRRCGFGSPPAFSRVFKSVLGITPLKFRKKGHPLDAVVAPVAEADFSL